MLTSICTTEMHLIKRKYLQIWEKAKILPITQRCRSEIYVLIEHLCDDIKPINFLAVPSSLFSHDWNLALSSSISGEAYIHFITMSEFLRFTGMDFVVKGQDCIAWSNTGNALVVSSTCLVPTWCCLGFAGLSSILGSSRSFSLVM